MKTQSLLLLLGGLASLASGSPECQTIINCKSTSTVTTTITSAVTTTTVRETDTVTTTTTILDPGLATTCTPCSVESAGTTAGTVPMAPVTTTAPAPAPLCTTTVQDWNRVSLMWTPEHPKPGPPSPATFASNFDYETILTLTDDSDSLERFEVYQDFQLIGRTSERTAESTVRKGVFDAGEAIGLGFSHGSFTVPAGAHTFTVTWQEAANNPQVHDWSGGALQYRFERVGPCN
ncbi:hypothetical protein BDW68DRAFT_164003 [Aspergillus falconensis]